MDHGERGLDRVVAHAAEGVVGHVEQTIGGDGAVAAPGADVAQVVLRVRGGVDAADRAGAEEEERLAADRVVAAAARPERHPSHVLAGARVEDVSALVDEGVAAHNDGLGSHVALPGRLAAGGLEGVGLAELGGEQDACALSVGQPGVVAPHGEPGAHAEGAVLDHAAPPHGARAGVEGNDFGGQGGRQVAANE